MAHELEVVDGKARMFYVGAAPWHGLGTTLNEPPTIEEGIIRAGLDWDVRLQPLHTRFDGEEMSVPGYATVRSTDRKVLGVVGPTYRPVQNKDAFKFFQPFIDAKEATLETAGSLRGGTRVWVLARVCQTATEIAPNDPVERFILLSNGHDGTLAVRAGLTPVRVVCQNTLTMAHGDGGSKLLRIRHTAKAKEALDLVQQTMRAVNAEFEATFEQFKMLAKKGVRKEDLEKYVRRVFAPKLVEKPSDAEGEKDSCERLLPPIIRLFEEGAGSDLPGSKGTWWGAYNSVTAFLSHERGRSTDNRLNSIWFGDSLRLNSVALRTAVLMAA